MAGESSLVADLKMSANQIYRFYECTSTLISNQVHTAHQYLAWMYAGVHSSCDMFSLHVHVCASVDRSALCPPKIHVGILQQNNILPSIHVCGVDCFRETVECSTGIGQMLWCGHNPHPPNTFMFVYATNIVVSFPDPILCEGMGQWTLEQFLSFRFQIAWAAKVMKRYHWRHGLFDVKASRNSVVQGSGHMTAESAQPRKHSNFWCLGTGRDCKHWSLWHNIVMIVHMIELLSLCKLVIHVTFLVHTHTHAHTHAHITHVAAWDAELDNLQLRQSLCPTQCVLSLSIQATAVSGVRSDGVLPLPQWPWGYPALICSHCGHCHEQCTQHSG